MERARHLESAEAQLGYWRAEGLKSLGEVSLSLAAKTDAGRSFLRRAAGTAETEDDRLAVVLAEMELPNPVMLGAGWDKRGRAVAAMEALGFGGVEVGTVLMYPQTGNPKARLWTQATPEGRVGLNTLGFNSPGMESVRGNIERNAPAEIPVGISLGKNKLATAEEAATQHARVAEFLYPCADYFVLALSSPNTPGLRDLQGKQPLSEIVQAVNETMDRCGGRLPLFVKIAPGLSAREIDDVIEVTREYGLAGIEATNTTTNEGIKSRHGWTGRAGGVSGSDPEYRKRATEVIRYVADQAEDQYEVIGLGGINSAETALEKIAAGATAVQLVTAVREHGLRTATTINRGILEYLDRNGLSSVGEVRGQGEL